jgi:hypothetical protein
MGRNIVHSGEVLEEQAKLDLNAVGQLRPYIGAKLSEFYYSRTECL